MDGVAVEAAGARVGVGNKLGAVIGQYRLASGDAGQNAFAPAGETREKVRFDKTFGDQQVGVQRMSVEPKRATRGQGAEVAQAGEVFAVVKDEPLGVADAVAELGPQLAVRRGPVAAGGDQNSDRDLRIAAAQPLQQDGKSDMAGHGAGVVAGNHCHRLLAGGQRLQSLRADRVVESLVDASLLLIQRGRYAV